MAKIDYFECSRCKERFAPKGPQTVCGKCAGTLYVRYDLKALRGCAHRDEIARVVRAAGGKFQESGTIPQGQSPGEMTALKGGAKAPTHVNKAKLSPHDAGAFRWAGMWRYRSVLPEAEPVTLGEGWTPMLRSRRYANVYMKEEGANPTGSFKARGMAMAVTMARAYGLDKLAAPSAGNAAGALAAYAAAAGIEAHLFMPKDVPFANYLEAVMYGAKVTLVDGLISDCGRMVAERKEREGWFDVSTLKEPFRVEGKKTMGYELVEQLGWECPDAVFYPTGGGVGLIGMWKAFEEMEELGWVRPGQRPRMFAVQSAGCAPVVRAFERHEKASEMWKDAATFASGLRVPKPFGDYIILEILRESGGLPVAVPDEEILWSLRDWAQNEGMFLCPEGAAVTAAYHRLLKDGVVKREERVVLFNTGAGLKYTDVTAEAAGIRKGGKEGRN